MSSESVKRTTNWFSVLPALVIPICLGLVFYIGLKAAIEHAWITDETVLRYLIGHPISEISVAMFFVGLASLMMISLDLLQQFRSAEWIRLETALPQTGSDNTDENEESPSELAATLARKLAQTDTSYQGHYLFQRLASTLRLIHQNGSASHVEEELKYLADMDAEQQQQRYSLVQILIWATPMLGFLGTVLGISQALGGITVGPDNDFQQMMDGLKASLYVAFDTTALALTLSMVLMFGQFFVERFESQLLRMVDHLAHTEIASQFDLSGEVTQDPGNRLESRLIASVEAATERQTELWRESLQWAGSAVSDAIRDSQNKFESSLESTLDNSLQGLAFNLGESISRADQSMSHRWEQWQVLLSENARSVSKNQTAFVEQTQAVCRMLELTTQQTSQSTKEISAQMCAQTKEVSDQLRLQTSQMKQHLDSVSQELNNGMFVAKLGEFLTTQKVANMALASKRSENRNTATGDQPMVVEGQWISVSPTFLAGKEDLKQVILPLPLKNASPSQPNPENSPTVSSKRSAYEPEVILPFLKKSA